MTLRLLPLALSLFAFACSAPAPGTHGTESPVDGAAGNGAASNGAGNGNSAAAGNASTPSTTPAATATLFCATRDAYLTSAADAFKKVDAASLPKAATDSLAKINGSTTTAALATFAVGSSTVFVDVQKSADGTSTVTEFVSSAGEVLGTAYTGDDGTLEFRTLTFGDDGQPASSPDVLSCSTAQPAGSGPKLAP